MLGSRIALGNLKEKAYYALSRRPPLVHSLKLRSTADALSIRPLTGCMAD